MYVEFLKKAFCETCKFNCNLHFFCFKAETPFLSKFGKTIQIFV